MYNQQTPSISFNGKRPTVLATSDISSFPQMSCPYPEIKKKRKKCSSAELITIKEVSSPLAGQKTEEKKNDSRQAYKTLN